VGCFVGLSGTAVTQAQLNSLEESTTRNESLCAIKTKISRVSRPHQNTIIGPLIVVLILGAIAYWMLEIRKRSSYAVCLLGFNHTEQAIQTFSVNGEWGGRMNHKESGDSYTEGGGCLRCNNKW
jgi:hypothetical protein